MNTQKRLTVFSIAASFLSMLFIYNFNAQAQVAGINYNSSCQHNQYLCINPTNGSVTVLNTFDYDSGFYYGNSFTTDVTQGRAYAISSAGTLYTFDLATGIIQQSRWLDPFQHCRNSSRFARPTARY